MATENYVAVIGKPVTRAMVDAWVCADDMVAVLAVEKMHNGAICGNAITYDEICISIDCAAVAGIVILEAKNGEGKPDVRFRQFPVNPGSWCERDGMFCISPCIDIISDCCEPVEEEPKKCPPWKVDWCKRWEEKQAELDQKLGGMTTQVSAHGRSKTMQRFEQWMCDKLEQQIREAKNKCLLCRGMRPRGILSTIPRRSYRR